MREIKRIDKRSLAKIIAFFYGLPGVAMFIGFLTASLANIFTDNDLAFPMWRGVLFVIGFSIVAGAGVILILAGFGWLVGFTAAYFYNLAAPRIGGLKIDVGEETVPGQKNLFNYNK